MKVYTVKFSDGYIKCFRDLELARSYAENLKCGEPRIFVLNIKTAQDVVNLVDDCCQAILDKGVL